MIKINDKKWSEFYISELFEVSGTTTTHPSKLVKGGNTPRITCSSTNNGLDNLYSNKPTEIGGVLTVDSATVGYISYQEKNFIATDHVEKIFIKNKTIHRNLGLGLITAIKNSTLNKFNYGYKFSQERIKKQKILLPINNNKKPDYEYMEQYTKSLMKKKLEDYKKFAQKVLKEIEYKKISKLEDINFQEFELGKLFKLEQGKSKGLNHLQKVEKFGINYLGATNSNNGVLAYVEKNEKTQKMIQKGNGIAFIRNGNGSVGYSVYKYEEFIATSDISVGYSEHLNKYVGLFITTIADKARSKYSFGYKRSDTRLKKEKLLLPINEKNEPDFEYMEQYMKNLTYTKIHQYLNYLQKQNIGN